jgi:hypothetical protein
VGRAGEALLASYAVERGPVGERNTRRSVAPGVPHPADGVIGDLGTRYTSPAIAGGVAELVDPHDLAAAPGERAPHVSAAGARRSTCGRGA